MIPPYGKVWALGNRSIADIFGAQVIVQEKVDGSQFSFGMLDGELQIRSKGQDLTHEGAERNKMFGEAVDYVRTLGDLLPQDVVFRGEVLSRPKHNVLAYNRAPRHAVVLFDAEVRELAAFNPASPYEVRVWAEPLDLEVVPTFFEGMVYNPEQVREFFERESFLGGPKIEGVVVKRYDAFDPFGHWMRGKLVSEAYKEVHGKEWKAANPNTQDLVTNLIEIYRHENRWEKAVQHLRDEGVLEDDPRDIGQLIKAVTEDVLAECKDEIAEAAFKFVWRKGVGRGITAGLPEWYKQRLLESAFAEVAA